MGGWGVMRKVSKFRGNASDTLNDVKISFEIACYFSSS